MFSPDGTLISASAAPHCRDTRGVGKLSWFMSDIMWCVYACMCVCVCVCMCANCEALCAPVWRVNCALKKCFIIIIINRNIPTMWRWAHGDSDQVHNYRTQIQKNNNMFCSLLVFCRHSTWEPASIVCNDEVTYLILQAQQEPVLATANAGRTWERFRKKCRWMNWKGRN